MNVDFTEKRSEPRRIIDQYHSVEFSLRDCAFTYQFKIWDISSKGICVLVKEDSNFKTALSFLFTIILLHCFLLTSAWAQKFPKPKGAINDYAEVIAPQYARPMDLLAREVLQKTGTSIVVVTLKSIGDNDPADYANRLYEAWGIGKKGEDKGVLILLAVEERKVRIETGYGVEGILPDGLVGEILDTYVVPYLKKGNYNKGLSNALAVVSSVIAKDAEISLTGSSTTNYQTKKKLKERPRINLFYLILFLIVLTMLLGTRRGRTILPFILLMLLAGSRGGGGSFGGFGGGFGGFGGGLSGGGGAGRGF